MLRPNTPLPQLNDSKKLSAKQRAALRILIEKEALAWAVGIVYPEEIDRINILNASFLAMHRAIEQLADLPGHLLIDGNRFKQYKNTTHSCHVGGDAQYAAIAAASILAKTHRDEHMSELHKSFPVYEWNHNMGYPTRGHRMAIREYGITVHHRKSFRCRSENGNLSLFE
jgi:ribonuclease HII